VRDLETFSEFVALCFQIVTSSAWQSDGAKGIIEERGKSTQCRVLSTKYSVVSALIRRRGSGISVACRAGAQEALHFGSDPSVLRVRGAHSRRGPVVAAVASVKSDASGVNKIARDEHVWMKLGGFERFGWLLR
jgi:hypothetical protein